MSISAPAAVVVAHPVLQRELLVEYDVDVIDVLIAPHRFE